MTLTPNERLILQLEKGNLKKGIQRGYVEWVASHQLNIKRKNMKIRAINPVT